MKNSKNKNDPASASIRRVLCMASCIVSALMLQMPSAEAQQVRQPRANSAVPADSAVPQIKPVVLVEEKADAPEEIVEMSPFRVEASRNDIGYYQENTLAGSRLNTNLGDLASSITVVTLQQMNDTASADMNDIFLYEANTEGAGNYTTFSFSSAGLGGGEVSDANARAPETANRVRGLGSVDRSRNYYPSLAMLPFDKYNTESVEINRGPNSLLFGLGSAAGIVNQSTALANTTKRSAQISMQGDSYGGYRGSFKTNIPLIPRKLGLFAGGLYDDRGFLRKPSYETTRRGYVAVTAHVSQDTTIRANVELFNSHNKRPNTVTPSDMVTAWLEAGRPSWNPYTRTLIREGQPDVEIPASGSTSGLNDVIYPGIKGDGASSVPGMYYDTKISPEPLVWIQNRLGKDGLYAPASGYMTAMSLGSNEISKSTSTQGRPLYNLIGVTNKELYDWNNINTLSLNTGTWRGQTYNVEIDRRITKNLYLQLGWYREEYKAVRKDYMGGAGIFVDINTALLDGSGNPFYGRTYIPVSGLYDTHMARSNDNWRMSLAYELDFSRNNGWTSWLGRHRLMALGSRQRLDSKNTRYAYIITDDHAWTSNVNRVESTVAAQRTLNMRFYVGGDGRVDYAPGALYLDTMSRPLRWASYTGPDGGQSSADYYYAWQDEMVTTGLALSNAGSSHDLQTVDSLSTALQSYWLKDRVVSTLGFRRDRSTSRYNISPLSLEADGSGFYDAANLDIFGAKAQSLGNTITAGVVVKPFKWFSMFYNRSENFTAAAIRYDLFHNELPLPTGTGQDYGVRFSFMNNKFVLGVNRFEASADNARGTDADLYIGRTARVDELWFRQWCIDSAGLLYGPDATAEQIDAYVKAKMQMPNDAPVPVEATVAGTSTVDADGWEIQAIYNPVRNWNMKLTVGQQRARYTNVAPEWDAYNAARLSVWENAVNENGEHFWDALNYVSANQPVGAWYTNSVLTAIKIAKANEGKQTKNQREWRASFITTYRFLNGFFKGVDVGGGVRWEDRAVIGYLADDADPEGMLDPNKPVYDKPQTHVDFWLGYNFKCPWFGNKVRGRAQMNVRDLTESGKLMPVGVNPNGTYTVYRIVDPRQFIFSLTFDF
jgi:outer membrane receptor protein involved in Fe transport